MRKILVLAIAGIIFGVVMAGSGAATALDPELVKIGVSSGVISFGMEGNASFLAPMPIFYNVKPMHTPIYKYDFHATQHMICTD
jgi:hypothetical protein